MKKILFVQIALVFALGSCKKQDLIEEKSSNSTLLNYDLPSELINKIDQENGLVVFKDRTHFDIVTNLLEFETQKYIETYISSLGEINEEELNTIIEEDNFNPNLVYETFEKLHGINSLRAHLKIEEDNWLDNEELTEENPTIYPLSERILPIANINGEYEIGESIYHVQKSGLVYEVLNRDYNVLESIRKGNFDINRRLDNSNVIVHRREATESNEKTGTECNAYIRKTWHVCLGSHRMDMILDVDWDGWGSAAKAKTKAYRKKKKLFGGERWGRHWTAMYAKVEIQDYNIDCDPQAHQVKAKSQDWAYFVSVHVYEDLDGFRVMRDGTFGGQYSTSKIGLHTLVHL